MVRYFQDIYLATVPEVQEYNPIYVLFSLRAILTLHIFQYAKSSVTFQLILFWLGEH